MSQSAKAGDDSPVDLLAWVRTVDALEIVRTAILPMLIIAGATFAYVKYGVTPPQDRGEGAVETPTPVALTTAKPFDGQIEIEVEGVATPFRQISIAAEISGRIKFKSPLFEEGNFIAAGTVIAEIDPVDYEIAVRRLKEELRQANNALEEWKVDRENVLHQIDLAEKDAELARKDVERITTLVNRKAIADTELDRALRTELAAQTALLQFRNQLRALDAREARLISARDLQLAALERAERDLARTKIVAPCDGTVITENVEQDGYVQAGATIAVFNDVSAAEIACNLQLDDLFWIWGTRDGDAILERAKNDPSAYYEFPATKVSVEFPFQGLVAVWEGTLTRFAGTGVDPRTRTIPCRVHVENPSKGELRSAAGVAPHGLVAPPLTTGMFVTIRAFTKPHAPLLDLPADAVRSGDVAWVMRDGRLHITKLQVARRTRDHRVLVYAAPDGLQVEDRIVISPMAMVREGMLLTERTSS